MLNNELIYVCSPYAGDVENNIINACKYSRYVYEKGHIPITPHLLYPQFLDDSNPYERKEALFIGTKLLSLCKEIWVFGDTLSSGMQSEIAYAKANNIEIKYIKEV